MAAVAANEGPREGAEVAGHAKASEALKMVAAVTAAVESLDSNQGPQAEGTQAKRPSLERLDPPPCLEQGGPPVKAPPAESSGTPGKAPPTPSGGKDMLRSL